MVDSKAFLRGDIGTFVEQAFNTLNPATEYLYNWHIDEIAQKLEDAAKGRIKRLVISMPPRYLKSVCISVAWPAWLLGLNPARKPQIAMMRKRYEKMLDMKRPLL